MNEGTITSSSRPTPSAQRYRERLGPVGYAHAVGHAEVVGELLLERLHLGAEDEALGGDHAREGLRQPLVVLGERGGKQGDRAQDG